MRTNGGEVTGPLRWLPVVVLVVVATGAITQPSPRRAGVPFTVLAGASATACPSWALAPYDECTDDSASSADPIVIVDEFESVIATVTAPRIVARSAPRPDTRAVAAFPKRSPEGVPQVFLLTAGSGEDLAEEGPDGTSWYEALLPVRPNGTTGFLPADSVSLSSTPYRIEVDRSAFRLTLWKGFQVVDRMTIGLGTGKTPTPVGRFYLTSLLRPPNPNTIYGTYAYGLSGYSEVLTDWEGGGVVGLHGTNDPSSIGRRASHGCIRMRNRDIEKLVPLLPLGVPIEII